MDQHKRAVQTIHVNKNMEHALEYWNKEKMERIV